METLNETGVEQKLAGLAGWERREQAIEKTFIFPDFLRALDFVNAVATAAEAQNHHPDITIHYNKVTMSLTTHSEGGLTDKDFDMAGRIEALNIGIMERLNP